MRFLLVDRITELKPGESITAVKALAMAEEYLDDHFPLFPVMPGVLMLEAMFQASRWLIYKSEDFAHSIVMLKEARNVKYNDFIEPGEVLTVSASILKQDETTVTLKARGEVGGVEAVSARLIVERFNLAERHPTRAAVDDHVRREMRKKLDHLLRPVHAHAPASA